MSTLPCWPMCLPRPRSVYPNMMPFMKVRALPPIAISLALLCALPALAEQKPKKDEIVKPMAGPRAVALRVTWLYVAPDRGGQKVDRVQPGREMVIAEKSGPWIRVYANTDIVEVSRKDAPIIGSP